jgi:toxin ParE1/3/4
MVEVNWTEQALADIQSIAEFIAKDSEKYASIQVSRFFAKGKLISSFPEAGRIVPELNQSDIREIILPFYRIIYRIVSDSQVDVLSVHHSSRQLTDDDVD